MEKSIIYIFSLFFVLISCNKKEKVDLIVHNAVVYTVDSAFQKAEALAIKDGKFVAIGKNKEILEKYEAENTVDIQQRTIFPGFYDAHCHFAGLGTLSQQADLVGAKSFGQIISRLKKFNKQNPNKKWILGRGWDQNLWEKKEFPEKTKLDSMFPEKPVFLERVDGHAVLVNQKALDLAGITAQTKIDGGSVVLKNGKPTGVLIDNAVTLVQKVIPPPSVEELKEMLLYAQNLCFAKGLTTVVDAGLDKNVILMIDSLQKTKDLKIGVYAMLNPTQENKDYFLKKGIYQTEKLQVRSFKIYADGALGSRGALLLKPYTDDPKTQGLILTPAEVIDNLLKEIYEGGYQANTHCIGDSANRLVLDLYGKYLKGSNDKRWRIEHAQVVEPRELIKFKQFSVIPSVQPTHATSDMAWAITRLGENRIKNAYAYQSLLEQNGLIAFGTDFPVEDLNPIYTFHAATARRDASHSPDNGFQMENALSAKNTLQAMTIWAAYSVFEEKQKGSIEIGKQADFVVLDTDLMETDFRLLRLTRVLNTFVAGEKVFSNYEAGY